MDGYAIVAADTSGATEATPVQLRVTGEGRREPRRTQRSRPARPSGSPPAPRSRPAPTPSCRSRRRPRSTPKGARARGPRRGRPAASRDLLSTRWFRPVARSGGPAATCRPGTASSRPGLVVTAAGDRARSPAPESRRSPSTGGRGSRSSLRATRSARRARPLGDAGIPDANGPDSWPRSRPRAARRSTWDRGDDLDDVLARLRRALERRRRRHRRVGRCLGWAVRRGADRLRADRPDRSLAGRGPARQAVRVRDAWIATDRRADAACSGCPATRSRPS